MEIQQGASSAGEERTVDVAHLYEVSLVLAFAPLEATSTSASANLTNGSTAIGNGTSVMSHGCGRFGCTVSFAYINEFFANGLPAMLSARESKAFVSFCFEGVVAEPRLYSWWKAYLLQHAVMPLLYYNGKHRPERLQASPLKGEEKDGGGGLLTAGVMSALMKHALYSPVNVQGDKEEKRGDTVSAFAGDGPTTTTTAATATTTAAAATATTAAAAATATTTSSAAGADDDDDKEGGDAIAETGRRGKKRGRVDKDKAAQREEEAAEQKSGRGLKRKYTEDEEQGSNSSSSSSSSNIKMIAPVLLLLRDSSLADDDDVDEGSDAAGGSGSSSTNPKSVTAHNSNGSAYSMVCLRIGTLLLQYAPEAVKPFKKEIIKFAWTRMKHADVSIKAWAYLCCARFIAIIDPTPRVTVQIYVQLLKSHQLETRSLAKRALDCLLAVLPDRL